MNTIHKLIGGAIASLTLIVPVSAFALGSGFGAGATGGSSSYVVTTLNDSGAGSFRTGVGTSGRDITFAVSGTITLLSECAIKSNITVDGGSGNITIAGKTTSLSGASNVIIKNMRFRQGETGDTGKDALQGAPCSNVMIDHCSLEYGRWDCLGLTNGSSDVSIEYCIIGQGIDPQYFGCICDGGNLISFHHNLWIDNNNRNPKLKGNCQYIDNIVYNWIDAGGVEGGHSSGVWKSDFINNTFIAGPQTSDTNAWINDCSSTDQWYVSGNYYDLNEDGKQNRGSIPNSGFTTAGVTLLSGTQYSPAVPVPVENASTAVSEAESGQFGCQPNDSFDDTLVDYLKSLGTEGRKGL